MIEFVIALFVIWVAYPYISTIDHSKMEYIDSEYLEALIDIKHSHRKIEKENKKLQTRLDDAEKVIEFYAKNKPHRLEHDYRSGDNYGFGWLDISNVAREYQEKYAQENKE